MDEVTSLLITIKFVMTALFKVKLKTIKYPFISHILLSHIKNFIA